MKRFLNSCWRETDGVLSFEWTLLAVLVVIGIVSGLAGARDAIIDELGDTAEAYLSIDQSYTFAGIPLLGIPPSSFVDPGHTFTECDRNQPLFDGVNFDPFPPDDFDS